MRGFVLLYIMCTRFFFRLFVDSPLSLISHKQLILLSILLKYFMKILAKTWQLLCVPIRTGMCMHHTRLLQILCVLFHSFGLVNFCYPTKTILHLYTE